MEEKVLVTEDILLDGMSERGGWNKRQLEILGVPWPPPKGWKKWVSGYLKLPKSEVERFLSLRKE